ncbi:hypothetical protein JCM8547_000676, partial [Rhodosporidiobolus lusitaniae]
MASRSLSSSSNPPSQVFNDDKTDEKGMVDVGPVVSPGNVNVRAVKGKDGNVYVGRDDVVVDAVFGEITDEGPNYR